MSTALHWVKIAVCHGYWGYGDSYTVRTIQNCWDYTRYKVLYSKHWRAKLIFFFHRWKEYIEENLNCSPNFSIILTVCMYPMSMCTVMFACCIIASTANYIASAISLLNITACNIATIEFITLCCTKDDVFAIAVMR